MIPSPSAISAIQAKVTDWTPDDATILASLNNELVANPVEQPQVLKPVAESAFLALLTDPANGSLGKLLNWVNFGLLKADIAAANRVGLALWCQVLPAVGLITPGEASAIVADLSATQGDPDWQAQIPWSTANLGRLVTLDDVAASRPNQGS